MVRILGIAILAACCAVSLTAAPPSDAAVEQAIRARFARSKIGANGFTVRVQGGTAVLTGRAAVAQHKGVATRLAKLAGAKRVDNRIELTPEARQKAAAGLEKARKKADLRRANVKRSGVRAAGG